ncbi:M14 family metallopeptidase [Salirhabdus salicampi]|uniref:M14 family metallopeptidase n=1 Tax=Salirhabdus salicampi TaxID=476102 RepID=UPI0020C462CB|nr:M14 family metallopeptidase [Salirhabdus salicampi]MCP8616107.1 M14 family metallopeptidase [Salirhabdus salicampi]
MKLIASHGETLFQLSKKFNIPFHLLQDANRYVPSELQGGESISIPGYLNNTHIIKSGETEHSISHKANIPLHILRFVNQNQAINPGSTWSLPFRIRTKTVKNQHHYDYHQLVTDLDLLTSIFPFIHIEQIGTSVMGKSIFEIKIGRGPKKIHLNGAFHANEWITSAAIMTALNDYLLALTNEEKMNDLDVSKFYENVTLSVVPMVNPDGVDLVLNGPPHDPYFKEQAVNINEGHTNFSSWKANINGVDLNNQFPAKWKVEKDRKVKHPAPRNFPGEKPLCEPEAKAMADLVEKENFHQVLAFHTQGKVIYWGYDEKEPVIAETIVNEYGRVSGYTPVQTVDSHAGFKDWYIQQYEQPGFTIELGKGISPLPHSQFPSVYEECCNIFLASLYMS